MVADLEEIGDEVAPLRAEELSARHGFFTRAGGVSNGIYAGLQCGFGAKADARENVQENRNRALRALGDGGSALATAYQAHTPRAIAVSRPWALEDAPEADALATREPGLAIGVVTADCAPVLLEDRAAGVVGAAHAGWKGALSGVLEAVLDVMESLGGRRDRIVAVVGPTIGPDSYEVGPEFVARFLDHDPRAARHFRAAATPEAEADGKARFDLPSFVVDRLTRAGAGSARWINEDTYAAASRYYSNRRALHQDEPDYGRLLSAIMIAPSSDGAG